MYLRDFIPFSEKENIIRILFVHICIVSTTSNGFVLSVRKYLKDGFSLLVFYKSL